MGRGDSAIGNGNEFLFRDITNLNYETLDYAFQFITTKFTRESFYNIMYLKNASQQDMDTNENEIQDEMQNVNEIQTINNVQNEIQTINDIQNQIQNEIQNQNQTDLCKSKKRKSQHDVSGNASRRLRSAPKLIAQNDGEQNNVAQNSEVHNQQVLNVNQNYYARQIDLNNSAELFNFNGVEFNQQHGVEFSQQHSQSQIEQSERQLLSQVEAILNPLNTQLASNSVGCFNLSDISLSPFCADFLNNIIEEELVKQN